jgi:sporulation protein YlmC with PRC-barrel domain
MLSLGSSLQNKQILSLRTGASIGQALEPLVNPNNLKLEGWHAEDRFTKRKGILLTQDIRDILPQGFVVNDHEAISDPSELVRLKDVLELHFELIGKPVYSDTKRRVGKVSDFSFEQEGFFIQKLYVAQSVIKSLSGGNVIIDRSQIVEITHARIVVKESTVKEGSEQAAIAPSFAS